MLDKGGAVMLLMQLLGGGGIVDQVNGDAHRRGLIKTEVNLMFKKTQQCDCSVHMLTFPLLVVGVENK